MTQAPVNNNNDNKIDVDEKLTALEKFIARRFDEISMEIEATSQLMEMAEEDAGKRFVDMLGMLNAISFAGDGTSPANSGKELESVVKETEKAATTIMDAADNIKNILEANEDMFAHDMHSASVSESIFNDIQTIIMACEFQDLVSQRVTTSVRNIRDIQEKLDATLSKFGIDTKSAKDPIKNETSAATSSEETASQGDIDALFD